MKGLSTRWGLGGFGFIFIIVLLFWYWQQHLANNLTRLQEPAKSRSKTKSVSSTNQSPQSQPRPNILKKIKNPARALKKKNSGTIQLTQAQKREKAQKIRDKIKQVLDQRAQHPPSSLAGLPRHQGTYVRNPKQQEAVDRLLEKLAPGSRLNMDNVTGTLRQLRGDLLPIVENSSTFTSARKTADYKGMATAMVKELSKIMNIDNPEEEFTIDRISDDDLGMTHVTLQQIYHGIPVWGAQVGVHFNKTQNPIEVSGLYTSTPHWLTDSLPKISEDDAIKKAKQVLGIIDSGLAPIKVNRMIYWDLDRTPVMAYRVDLTPRWDEDWQLFISTENGEVIHRYKATQNETISIKANDLLGVERDVAVWKEEATFYAIDTTTTSYDPSSTPPDPNRTRGAIFALDANNAPAETLGDLLFVTSNDPNTWDPAAISVLSNFHRVEAYFQNTFSRNSINDGGMTIYGVIHVGQNFDNAFWSGNRQMMFFGDGSEQAGGFTSLAASLDVTAHEITHGVTEHTAGLIYENQSGALNEHISDFFGAMLDRDEWLIGDDIAVGKEGLRDMQNPENPDMLSQQPTTMSEFARLPNNGFNDNGGVHINSGIPNRMSYLLADGPEGIGKEKTEKIIYRALTVYLVERSQFIDYRRVAISSAEDLFEMNSVEVDAVKAAFDAVEIFDGEETPTPTPGTPSSGNEQTVFIEAEPNSFNNMTNDYLYNLFLEEDGVLSLLTEKFVANTRPAVSGNGQFGLFIDQLFNLWFIGPTGESPITGQGELNFHSVAMSKNARFLAFTAEELDSTITLFDLELNSEDPDSIKFIELSIPQPDGEPALLELADILTFNFLGDTLAFDALSTVKLATGEEISIWGVYSLRLADSSLRQVVPLAPGTEIANPIFSHTSNTELLADRIITTEDGNEEFSLVKIDTRTREINVLNNALSILGEPSYRGDDSRILFRDFSDPLGTFQLLDVAFSEDRLTLDFETLSLVRFNVDPISFSVGFRVGEFTERKGQIQSASELDFGELALNEQMELDLTISNIGNGDLELFSIFTAGDDVESFAHDGLTQVIPPSQEYSFKVRFSPKKEGLLSTFLEIGSTDFDNPNLSIELRGMGMALPPVAIDAVSPGTANGIGSQTVTISEIIEINEGDSRVFTVNVSGGISPYSYTWQLEGLPIGSNLPELIYTPNHDQVVQPETGRELELTCTVTDAQSTNAASITWSRVKVNDVNRKPVISESRVNATISPGESEVVLMAIPIGNDDPDSEDSLSFFYQWRKNGAIIEGATSNSLQNSSGFEVGDQITVVITPFDGIDQGIPVESDPITIRQIEDLDWSFSINVMDGGESDIEIGMFPGATDNFDPDIDIVASAGMFDGSGDVFLLQDEIEYQKDARTVSSSADWFLIIVPDGNEIRLSWDNPLLPEGKHLSLYEVNRDGALIPGASIIMNNDNELLIPVGNTRSFKIRYASEIRVSMSFTEKWNIFSLPILPNQTGLKKNTNSPIFSGTMWTYQDARFQAVSTLIPFRGYWIYALEPKTITVDGFPPPPGQNEEFTVDENNNVSAQLKKGWNIFGPSNKLKINYPMLDPLRGTIWSWNGSQNKKALELKSRNAYWIYSLQSNINFNLSDLANE